MQEAKIPVNIINRDLVLNPPPLMKPEWIAAAFKKEELTILEEEILAVSDQYISEIIKSDLIVIGAPMYNYGMPASLKAWFDQIARINKTFSFDLSRGDFPIKPILSGKKLVVFTSSGEFGFQKGEIREEYNHLLPHIKGCAHYLGVDLKKDLYHLGIEYQEFKDERYQKSKDMAFERIEELVHQITEKAHAKR
jgi:FMN-dependent NADH-azoreductase